MLLSYRVRFLFEMAVLWIFTAGIHCSYIIKQIFFKDNSSYSPDNLTEAALYLFIWLGFFCIQSALLRFILVGHPFNFRSSLVLLGTIGLFALVYFISTILVPKGSPIVMVVILTLRLLGYDAEKTRYGYLMLYSITPLLLYMHACILRYDEDAEDTASTRLIRIGKQSWLIGMIVNGVASSILNGAIIKNAFFLSIFIWSCWFLLFLALPIVIRYNLPDSITSRYGRVALFVMSYALASGCFYFFNYIPSITVFLKSLASLLPSAGYFALRSALFNIFSSALLLFFLYRMHSGILSYEGEEDNSRNESAADQELRGAGNVGSRIGVEMEKEKKKLIISGAVIWFLGLVINFGFALHFGFIRWSLWFAFFLISPVAMRFAFFKHPIADLKYKIGLFLGSYLVLSLASHALKVTATPSLTLLERMLLFPIFASVSPYGSLFSPGFLFDVVTAILLLLALFYLHSAILSYEGEEIDSREGGLKEQESYRSTVTRKDYL